jgi:hypothetical protein
MSLIADLVEVPERRSPASRFTAASGVFYMAAGLLFLIWPGAIQAIFFDTDFVGREGALARLIGMLLAIIGWLYLFGGRSGARQFVAATIIDRIVVVPLVLVPTALAGVFPHVMITFAILDPSLALVSWYVRAAERR